MLDRQHDFIKYLKEKEVLSDRIAELVVIEAEKKQETLGKIITNFGVISEEKLATFYSMYCDLTMANLDDFPKTKLNIPGIEERFLIWLKVVVLSDTEQSIQLATADPLDDFAKNAIHYLTGKNVTYTVCLANEVDNYYED